MFTLPFVIAALVQIATPAAPADAAQVRAAVEKSLVFLEKDGLEWETTKCVSCHHGPWMMWSGYEARKRGFAVNEKSLEVVRAGVLKAYGEHPTMRPTSRDVLNDLAINLTYLTFGLGAAGEPDAETAKFFDKTVAHLLERQKEDGSWRVLLTKIDGRPVPSGTTTLQGSVTTFLMPPLIDHDDITTMLVLLTLTYREPAAISKETLDKAKERGLKFLSENPPGEDLQSLVMRVLLNQRLNKADELQTLVKQLLSVQNDDGGWSQSKKLKSDALGTGQALLALATAGLTVKDPAVAKTWDYLVKNQKEDGSWFVNSRAYQRPEFSSYMGTAWATLALVKTLPMDEAAGKTTFTAIQNDEDSQAEGTVLTLTGHTTGISALTFSPDSRQIYSASSNDVRTWDVATGKEVSALKGTGGAIAAFSGDGKRLAIAGREKVVVLDTASGKELLGIEPHGDWDRTFPFRPAIAAVAFSPDGRWLATGGSVTKVGGPHGLPGGVVTIWDAKTGKAIHRFDKLSTGVSSVSFSSDNSMVAAGTNGAGGELPDPGEIWVWDVEKGRAVGSFKVKDKSDYGEYVAAADTALSPDGKWVAAAVSAGSRGRPAGLLIEDKASTVRVWELATGKEVLNLRGHATGIGRVAFSPDGKLLAAAGGDRAVRLWSTTTGKELKPLPFDTAHIESLAFSPDNQRLTAGAAGKDKLGEIRVWALPKD